jgi:hypothetical protein
LPDLDPEVSSPLPLPLSLSSPPLLLPCAPTPPSRTRGPCARPLPRPLARRCPLPRPPRAVAAPPPGSPGAVAAPSRGAAPPTALWRGVTLPLLPSCGAASPGPRPLGRGSLAPLCASSPPGVAPLRAAPTPGQRGPRCGPQHGPSWLAQRIPARAAPARVAIESWLNEFLNLV